MSMDATPGLPAVREDGGVIFGVLNIAPDRHEVPRARKWIADVVAARIAHPLSIAADAVDDLLLCASEVITNAVLHGDGAITIVLVRRPNSVRVEVIDAGTASAEGLSHVRDDVPLDATSGRGLMIVEALADTWGTRADDAGRTVWFEVEF
ncbi:ATP-binding protein [Spirillospora sp. NBC_01491]|uniref:ATP-binding protein n=1 Tax=Spirillospora sp. NBC_01491 TaxID=2976007 RepID=UPI002E2EA7A7|nr:ATP-binding protein [Spirillospora sp. NBC_01491]